MPRRRKARGPNNFRKNDVIRAIKSAEDAGVSVAGVEITCKDGTVIRVFGPDPDTSGTTNSWDEVLKDAADTKRPA